MSWLSSAGSSGPRGESASALSASQAQWRIGPLMMGGVREHQWLKQHGPHTKSVVRALQAHATCAPAVIVGSRSWSTACAKKHTLRRQAAPSLQSCTGGAWCSRADVSAGWTDEDVPVCKEPQREAMPASRLEVSPASGSG